METQTVTTQPASDTPADIMDATIKGVMAEVPSAELVATNNAGERSRDPETGKFVAQATDTAPGSEAVPGEGAEALEGDAPKIEVPEGYVLPPTLSEDKTQEFKVRDAEGEIMPPDLKWEFTANGKPREVSTDNLVKFAQMGIYNHEREVMFGQQQQHTSQLEGTVQQYAEAYQEQAQTIERLLSDPEYLVQSIQEYEKNNTPEARAERARQELEAERQQMALHQMERQAEEFISTRLEPALDLIAEQLPTVTREELAARLLLAVDRYRVNGVLRPEGYDPARQYVATDLLAWAQQVHEHRQSERTAPVKQVEDVKKQAKSDIERAQARAQRAKRQATLATRPAGKAMLESAPPKPIRTSKDVEDAVIGGSLREMTG